MTSQEILARIDAVIGGPETESDSEHDDRIKWVERETLRRRLSHDIPKRT